MKPNNDTPSIRFAGFTGAWEQRKLGKLAVFNPKDDMPCEFEYVDLGSVVGSEMLSHRRESKQTAPSRAQRLARSGDLFYQTVRPYQKNNYLFELPDNDYVFSTGYAQMRPVVDGYFLLSLVQQESFVKVVLDNCTGTSYPAINANDLADISVSSPLLSEECKKIGHFFRCIDTLIALHQRKYGQLVNIKKACLEKMFPKNGELVPEVRFAGFTDAWEQRKIESEIQTIPFKSILATPEIDGKYPIIQQGDSPVLGYSNKPPFLEYSGVVLFGDHTLSLYRPDSPFLVATDGIRIVKSEDEHSAFLLYFLERYKPISEGYKRYFSILADRIGSKPMTQEERAKIGSFFERLDRLITLHQRKLERLQNIKKACLEKMFV